LSFLPLDGIGTTIRATGTVGVTVRATIDATDPIGSTIRATEMIVRVTVTVGTTIRVAATSNLGSAFEDIGGKPNQTIGLNTRANALEDFR